MHRATHTKYHTGFTLIETLVAIFIFSSALVALAGIAARGVSSVNRAKEVVVAEFLAQEGLEVVRTIRDTTTLTGGADWDEGFASVAGGVNCEDSVCDIRYDNGLELVPCPGTTCQPLRIENGMYSADGTATTSANTVIQTNFMRTIQVRRLATNTLGEPIEYAVFSRVTWPVGIGQRSVEMVTTLTDWQ